MDVRAKPIQGVPPNAMGAKVTHHKGKGSQQELLPHRSAVSKLVRGPQQTMNNYAKATPMASPDMSSPDMNDMATPNVGG